MHGGPQEARTPRSTSDVSMHRAPNGLERPAGPSPCRDLSMDGAQRTCMEAIPLRQSQDQDELVCLCAGVSRARIKAAIATTPASP